jgi:hypothetical protein
MEDHAMRFAFYSLVAAALVGIGGSSLFAAPPDATPEKAPVRPAVLTVDGSSDALQVQPVRRQYYRYDYRYDYRPYYRYGYRHPYYHDRYYYRPYGHRYYDDGFYYNGPRFGFGFRW